MEYPSVLHRAEARWGWRQGEAVGKGEQHWLNLPLPIPAEAGLVSSFIFSAPSPLCSLKVGEVRGESNLREQPRALINMPATH